MFPALLSTPGFNINETPETPDPDTGIYLLLAAGAAGARSSELGGGGRKKGKKKNRGKGDGKW